MNNKYLILFTVVIGAFVGNLEAVLPNTAMSVMADSLDASVHSATWILSIYTLLFATFMPLASKIGWMIGNRKLYIWSLLLFSLFSLLCGLTDNLVLLVLFRAFQGIVISACLPCAMMMISRHFQAEERGKAMGILGMVVASSTAIGAPLGGILTDSLGWHSIFSIVAPVAFLGALFSLLLIPKENVNQAKGSFDGKGAVFFSSFVIFLMLFISNAGKDGIFSAANVVLAILSAITFVAFLKTEKRVESPFIPLQLFRNASFNSISISRALQMAMLYGALFLIPLYWSKVYQHMPKETGLALFLLPIVIMLFSPIAGNFIDRWGSKRFMLLGMGSASLGALGLTVFPGDVWSVGMTIHLILLGIGFAMMQSSAMTAVTLVLPRDLMNVGVGIFNMLTFTGGTIGLSLFSAVLDYTGFQWVFLLMFLAGLTGFLVSLRANVPAGRKTQN